MRIGIQNADLRRDYDLELCYRLIKEAGFECIDFNLDNVMDGTRLGKGTYRGSSPIEEGVSALQLYFAKDLAAIEKYGLFVTQVHAPFPSYASGDPESLDYMIDVFKTSIRFTEMIGAKNLIIHGISYNGDNAETQDDIDELNFKLYSSLIPTLRECNVTVCLENLFTRYKNGKGFRTIYAGHCSDPYDAVAEIDMLNDLAGKECFGLCLDTGHLNLVGIPVKKYISILGSRIKCLHVHDNCGLEDDHLSPYTGTVRWQDHITALRDIGYNGDISFETFKQVKSTVVPEPLVLPWLKLMASIADYFRQEITK